MSDSDTADISLVLGAGGARGLAHIGAIEALEAAGYRIRAIAGSSMGAVIGGIYAAGKLDMIHEFHRAAELIELGRQRTDQALSEFLRH